MLILRYSLIMLLVAGAHSANAWDSVWRDGFLSLTDFHPLRMTPLSDTGYWVAGAIDGRDAIVNYRLNNTVRTVRYLTSARPEFSIGSYLVALRDGGVVVVQNPTNSIGTGCSIWNFDVDANLRWFKRLEGADFSDTCGQPAEDEGGGIWLSTPNRLLRLDRRGVVQTRLSAQTLGVDSITAYATDHRAAGVFVATTSLPNADATTERATIFRFDADGNIVWSWKSRVASSFNKIDIDSRNNIYAFGINQSETRQLYSTSMATNGSVRWTRTFDGTSNSTLLDVTISDLDTIYLLASPAAVLGDPAPLNVLKVDADGNLAWTRSARNTKCDSSNGWGCAIRSSFRNNAVLIAGDSHEGAPQSRVYWIDENGAVVGNVTSTFDRVDDGVVLGDESLLLIAARRESGVVVESGFTRFRSDANADDPPRTHDLLSASGRVLADRLLANGDTILVSGSINSKTYALTRLDAQNHILWRTIYNGAWPGGASIAIGGNRICVHGARAAGGDATLDLELQCVSTADGTGIINRSLLNGQGGTLTVGVSDDGSIVAVYAGASGTPLHHALLASDGHTLHDIAVLDGAKASAVTVGANGVAVLATAATPSQVIRLDRDGNVSWRTADPSATAVFSNIVLLDDSTTLLAGRAAAGASGGLSAWRIDANGQTLWQRNVASDVFALAGLQVRGPDVYATARSLVPLPNGSRGSSELVKFALADGSTAWLTHFDERQLLTQAELDELFTGQASQIPIPLAAGDRRVFLAKATAHRVTVSRFDAASGVLLSSVPDDCAGENCAISDLALDSADTLRVLVTAVAPDDGRQAQVLSLPQASVDNVALRVDQSGLDGAWFAPYSGGQGFVIEYFPSAQAWFVPWFTYSFVGGNEPSEQRWYSLQGSVAPGATSASLPILQTDPGAFASGNVAGAHSIGSATLSFSSCNKGTLQYHLDSPDTVHGQTAQGTIGISRLTPATTPCVLADGSTQPATATTATNGFDARLSGSWYIPATNGQGFTFSLRPPDVFFATWFTFDPAAAPDDTSHQHWFTLQGSLNDAINGRLVLPITQTIGGSFDDRPTGNSYRVGTATLTIQSCSTARLEYRFDDADVAGPYRLLNGQMDLAKIGGCTP